MQTELMQAQCGPYRIDDVGRYERDGVKVLTSWLPVQRVYETLVVPYEWAALRLGGDWQQYGTDRVAAEYGHAEWVRAVDRAKDADAYRRSA